MNRKVTYGDLNAILENLGFVKRTDNGDVFFEERKTHAIVALPNLSDDAPVYPHHYVAARSEVDGMGVADKEDFGRAMRERGDLPAGILTVI